MSAAPDRIVVPEPTSPSVRLAQVTAALVLIGMHLLIPLRYYLGDDAYDERFAWRMFSGVRNQDCSLDFTETRDGVTTPVRASSVLPMPWVALLQRNREVLVEHVLRAQCARTSIESSRIVTECRDVHGQVLPRRARTLDCRTGELAVETLP
jgi:hypothetical protein